MQKKLTVGQTADLLGIGTFLVRKAIERGELKAVKMERRYLIDADDAQKWIDGRVVVVNVGQKED